MMFANNCSHSQLALLCSWCHLISCVSYKYVLHFPIERRLKIVRLEQTDQNYTGFSPICRKNSTFRQCCLVAKRNKYLM